MRVSSSIRWMQSRSPCFLLAFLFCVSVSSVAEAAVRIYLCTAPGRVDCLCVDWDRGFSTYLEVRCPTGDGGWTTDPTGKDPQPPGGWRGPGNEQPSDNPGTPPGGELGFAIAKAKDLAWKRLRGDQNCCIGGKPYYTPNECTKLFLGNELGSLGAGLIQNYVNFRNGEGVKDQKGNVPCNSAGTSAWTTCCNHDPDVLVCDKFKNLSTNDGAAILIHEVLHVAGQPEDSTTTAGPDDPPTSNDITASVKEACNL